MSYTSQLNLIDEWTVDWSSITLGRKLGEGEFSTVHRGLIAYESIPQPRQEHFTGMSVIPVAIKVLKGTLYSVFCILYMYNYCILYMYNYCILYMYIVYY